MTIANTRATGDADAALLKEVHAQAVRVPLREAADALYRLLTGKIAAYMVGIKDVRTLTHWVGGEVREIRVEHEARLRAAYEIATLLLHFDAPETVRAWFIGMNPELDDVAPIAVIRQDRLQDALGAARLRRQWLKWRRSRPRTVPSTVWGARRGPWPRRRRHVRQPF